MGAMKAPEKKEIPEGVVHLYDLYKEIKFSRVPKEDRFVLVPRGDLTYESLNAYIEISGLKLEMWEVSTLMRIDGVFNHARAS